MSATNDLLLRMMKEADEILADCRREADYDPEDDDHEAFRRYVDKLEGLAGALAVCRLQLKDGARP